MISKHVAYKEVVRSNTARRRGIKNIPTSRQLGRIIVLCKKVFEPLRKHVKKPIYISSMFRSAKLNRVLGGAKRSQHMANNGAAMDLDAHIFGKVTNRELGDYIKDNLEFDQLIYEDWDQDFDDYAWIHCSYNEGNNRNQVLHMYRVKGKVKYEIIK